MALNLPTLARQSGMRRNITLRPTEPTQANATSLAAIYAPAWRIWSENIDRIMAGYDPPPLADGLTRDSIDDIQSAIDAVADFFRTRLVTVITPALRDWSISVERWHRSKWVATVNAGTGIDLSTILTAQEVQEPLSAWLARNVALVRNVSEQAHGRIADAVFRGYQQRLPAREVAKEIREAVGLGRDRALRIASDQNTKLSAALDRERQAEAGIEWFRWRHSGKRHPREWHRERDQKVYDLRTGKARDDDETIPADDRGGVPPFCGCREQAYIPLMDEIE